MNHIKDLFESKGHARFYRKNSAIFNQDNGTSNVYYIIQGRVNLILDSVGKEYLLDSVISGDYFGDLSFIDGSPRECTAIAKIDTEVLILRRQNFDLIPSSFLFNLPIRIRTYTKKIELLGLYPIYNRLKDFLETLKSNGDHPLHYTHQEIANSIGASREMVSIMLKQLVSGKFISTKPYLQIRKSLPPTW